jgi:hypothetical protein
MAGHIKTALLTELEPVAPRNPWPAPSPLHDPCGRGSHRQPQTLLERHPTMTPSTLGISPDAADKRAVPSEVRLVAPPGPGRAYRAGKTTYVGREGQTIFVPSDHRSALLRQGWADAA